MARNSTGVLILAAGEGTRMKSSIPKVLHNVAGKPMLWHVIRAAKAIKPGSICVVTGRSTEMVEDAIRKWDTNIVVVRQKHRRGTADAVRAAENRFLKRFKRVVVLCGDAPLIEGNDLKTLLRAHGGGYAATVLGAIMENPFGYGRLLTDNEGILKKIVEEKDATDAQKQIGLVNSGIYCFEVKDLLEVLRRVRPVNAKNEYYLTDVIELLGQKNKKTGVAYCKARETAMGINDRTDLARANKIFRMKITEKLMRSGVTITDPDTTYIDCDVKIGRDTVIMPGTVIASGTVIGKLCQIGPYSHLRPGTRVASGVKVGNFTEIKNSRIGSFSKIPHLSYVGDTTIGRSVNVGAGTITCNYDGFKKYNTVISDGCFVGSNVNFVAPVKIGKGALIGAGSTITENVPGGSLAIARARQVNKAGRATKRRGAHT